MARLEAADEDFRDARERARRASALLLVVALLHIAVGGLYIMLQQSAAVVDVDDATATSIIALAQPLIVGALLLGCFFLSRRAPAAGLGAALALWLSSELLVLALSPASFLASFLSASGVALLFARLVVLIVLARGLLATRAASAMLAHAAGKRT